MPELHQLVAGDATRVLHDNRANKDIQVFEASHHDWPVLEASSHSTSTLAMAPGDWRLELEGVGWFRAWDGNCINWERWDDSVSDRDISTFLVTSALGALAMQRGSLVLHGTAIAVMAKRWSCSVVLRLGKAPWRGVSSSRGGEC